MYLLILAIPATWTIVLTVHLLKNPRTFLALLRWTAWTYLFVLALLMSEVVREGLLATHSDHEFIQDMGFWWFLWALLIVTGALSPGALIPAALLPLVLFSHPPFRLVVNYGLARLGWTGLVYSPVLWVAGRLGSVFWAGWRAVRAGGWTVEILSRLAEAGGPVALSEYGFEYS